MLKTFMQRLTDACESACEYMHAEDARYLAHEGFRESLASFTWEERIGMTISESRHPRLHALACRAWGAALLRREAQCAEMGEFD